MKSLTVVIASFKYGHLAAHCLESILSQTKLPDKIIIVDDGVGDMELVIDRYAEEYPDLISWVIRSENMGTVANFQEILMNRIETDMAMFVGADNYLRPDCLEKVLAIDADIVSYDIALFGTESAQFSRKVGAFENKDGFPIWRFKKGDINRTNYIHGSSLYNVELAKEVGGYIASGNRNSEEDWMLWRAMLAKGATHHHIQEPMLYYRRHKQNFIQPRKISNHETETVSDVELSDN